MRFTLQRQPSRPVSARTDRPSGGDVDSGVHVGVVGVVARLAPERLVLTVSWCAVPATRTRLTGVRRVDAFDPPGGFVLEPLNEQAPARGENASVESCLGASPVRQVAAWLGRVRLRFRPPRQLRDAEVFDADQIESAGKVRGSLLGPVLATIRRPGVKSRDRDPDPLPTVRIVLGSGEPALQLSKSPLLGLGESRAGEQLTSGQRSGHGDAAINTDDLTAAGCGDRLRHGGEGDMPAAQAVAVDPVRLRFGQCTGDPKPYPADLRNQHLGPLAAQPFDTARLRADDPESLPVASFAPARAAVATGMIVPACLIEVPQRLLLDGLRPTAQPTECGTCFGQLSGLLDVSRRGAPVARPHRPLLASQIPHVSRMSAVRQQPGTLCRSGIQAKARHATYSSNRRRQFSDHYEGRESRRLPRLKDGKGSRPAR